VNFPHDCLCGFGFDSLPSAFSVHQNLSNSHHHPISPSLQTNSTHWKINSLSHFLIHSDFQIDLPCLVITTAPVVYIQEKSVVVELYRKKKVSHSLFLRYHPWLCPRRDQFTHHFPQINTISCTNSISTTNDALTDLRHSSRQYIYLFYTYIPISIYALYCLQLLVILCVMLLAYTSLLSDMFSPIKTLNKCCYLFFKSIVLYYTYICIGILITHSITTEETPFRHHNILDSFSSSSSSS